MKFQHLPIGAPFEFEGKHYTKTSPLVAAEEGGGQRLIPRSAVLRILRPPGEVNKDNRLAIPADTVIAFTEFEQLVSRLMREAQGASDAQLATLQTMLVAAAQGFRGKLATGAGLN